MKDGLNSCIIYGAIKREGLLVKRKLNEEKVKKENLTLIGLRLSGFKYNNYSSDDLGKKVQYSWVRKG